VLRRAAVGALIVASMAACGERHAENPPVATVAGQSISSSFFNYYVAKKTGIAAERVDPALKKSLLDELIGLEAAAAAGLRSKSADVENDIELARLEVLAKAAADSQGITRAPAESELQAAYQSYVTTLPRKEFHVAHILVATEAQATQVIREIEKGAPFAVVAARQSTDASKARGGDLGWIVAGNLPTAFTDAVTVLKSGDYTEAPIQTPFGWHVIRLIEIRDTQPPPLDQVRAQLIVNLEQERYTQFVQSLLAKSTVTRP
jgi:peptidyl-prolyl cis-trans isomerase C